jgi:peptidyl-prolyl cis-trans isomerase D
MLQRIGDSLKGTGHTWQKVFGYILLGLLSVIFAAWGAYGIVNLNFGGSNYAAEANGIKIPVEEARNAWQRQQLQWQQRLNGAELPPELRTQLQNQTLENLIRGALIDERTHDLGYRVSREQLREAVQTEPAFQIDGAYSPEAAKAALAQAGISLATFEQELGHEVQRMHLESGIRGSDFVTPKELARITDLEDQERELRYFVLPPEQFKGEVKIDDAAVQAYYKAHQSNFMTPEADKLHYAELKLATLSTSQTVSDADLHAAYDKEKSHLELPEKRHARHILITGKDDATALAQAQQVLAQAKAGKDFGELAKQYSQDPGSAKNGGDLGWSDRSAFVKPFADTLFAMKVGDIAGPVKTQFGYHIIKLDEIQEGKSKSFEEARPDLEARLRKDHATDRFGEIQEQLQSKLQEPGADLNALAQEYGLTTGDVASFAKGAGGAPLGAAQQLQDALFGEPPLGAGKFAGPVILGDERLLVAQVLEHHPPQPKPLAEVRDGIVATLTHEQESQAALKAAQAAAKQLESGSSFDSVAGQLKVTAEPARFVNRTENAVPTQVREAAFATPRPAAGQPQVRAVALSQGGAGVVAVTAVRTPAAQQNLQAERERGRREADRMGDDDTIAYIQEVRRTAEVKKNPKVFD